MTRSFLRVIGAIAGVIALLTVAVAPAAAKASAFTFDYDGTVTDTTCGIPLEYYDVGKGSGRIFVDNTGAFTGIDLKNDGTAIYTNLKTGLSATLKYRALFKNFNEVDNGDGTFSADQTVVGASTLYGPNGEVLQRGHGPITLHLTYIPTENGPNFISQEITFEHGARPDLCSALIAAIG